MSTTTQYDAIVVGGRVAGSSTAFLLARAGCKVLVVDKATFPSDTLSTLVVMPPGVRALDRWGLLGEIAASGAPAIERFTFDFGPVVLSGRPHNADGTPGTGYAPRRTVIDTILLEAASAAGAEARQGFTVDEIVVDDGVVVGIRGHGEGTSTVTERARIVIGADGWNSVVARAVGAAKFHDKPVKENLYYNFWPGLPNRGMVTHLRGDRGIAVIPTNDDLHLVLVGFPFAHAAEFRADVEASYRAGLERVPELAEALRGTEPTERFVGGGVPNFFRQSFGPGWALVGDAAYTKDPITAQGISDALTGAESLVAGLQAAWTGNGEALARRHDEWLTTKLPFYEFTTHLAELSPPPPELAALLASLQGNQRGMDAFASLNCGTLSPSDFFAGLGAPVPG